MSLFQSQMIKHSNGQKTFTLIISQLAAASHVWLPEGIIPANLAWAKVLVPICRIQICVYLYIYVNRWLDHCISLCYIYIHYYTFTFHIVVYISNCQPYIRCSVWDETPFLAPASASSDGPLGPRYAACCQHPRPRFQSFWPWELWCGTVELWNCGTVELWNCGTMWKW